MPIYRYRCDGCKEIRDEFRSIADRDRAPECHGEMQRVIVPTMVNVFTPYRAVASEKDGGGCPMIRSRAEHNAFLRRNGYEEVGNDKSMAPLPDDEVRAKREEWKDSPDAPMVDVEKLKREGYIQEDLTV